MSNDSCGDSSSDSDSDSIQENLSLSFKRRKHQGLLPSKSRRLQSLEMVQLEHSREIHSTKEEDVDDSDNIDPEEEYKQWVVREKIRVKREFEQLMAMEEQIQQRLERQATHS